MTEMSIDDQPYPEAGKFYEQFRDEIKREDDITHHRLTSSLTLQGFLITASALIISRGIQNSGLNREIQCCPVN